MRIERHPIGVWVREDGCIYLPTSCKNPAHWTFGSKSKRGYLQVYIGGKKYLVHRLVAECYIPNPNNKPQVDHINRNRDDNRVENLRWATNSDNQRNTVKNDRVNSRGGVHWYEDKNQYDREHYYRNHEKYLAHKKEYNAHRCKTHKFVLFSDGKKRWLPNEQALELIKLPVKKRHYGNG